MINVAYCTDENYAKLMTISIVSLLENSKNSVEINFFCLEKGLSDNSKTNIKEIVNRYESKITFIDISKECEKLRFWKPERDTMFGRILIPELLPDKNVLYLDCDTLILDSLKDLQYIGIENAICMAAQDTTRLDAKIEAGLGKEDIYINSGVLFINCGRWLRNNTFQKFIAYEKKFPGEGFFPDQRPINAVLHKDIKLLPLKYNVTSDFFDISYSKLNRYLHGMLRYSKNEVEFAINRPSIIHFSGDFINRPWYKGCTHKFRTYFEYYEEKNDFTRICKKRIPIGKYIYQRLKKEIPISVRMIINKSKVKTIERKQVDK